MIEPQAESWSSALPFKGAPCRGNSFARAGTAWDVGTGQEIPFALHHSKAITELRLSPDGRILAAHSPAGVKIWDGTPGTR
jgi:hypothetical protein